jgi:Tat protein translocase TatB subunit
MFGTLGGPELFLIFVVALIVFGPRKLPEIGKSLGKMMAEFRKASNEFRSTIESEVEAEKIRDSLRIEPPQVVPAAPAFPLATSTPPEGAPAVAAEAGTATEPAPAPAAESVAVSEPAAAAAPETVSRQPESTRVEHS